MVKTPYNLIFSAGELQILKNTSKSRTAPKVHTQRAQMLLHMTQKIAPQQIAKMVGVSLSSVSRLKLKAKSFWAKRLDTGPPSHNRVPFKGPSEVWQETHYTDRGPTIGPKSVLYDPSRLWNGRKPLGIEPRS